MRLILTATALAATLGSPAQAFADLLLLEEKQCLQCHAPTRYVIGPSFRTIKAVYERMPNPEGSIIAVIRGGNDANLGPHWGPARMPNGSERPEVSEEEARALARWILR